MSKGDGSQMSQGDGSNGIELTIMSRITDR